MLNDLIRRIRKLPEKEQRIIFVLGVIATLMGFIAALDEWWDAIRPGFIGATAGSLIKDYINYLMGREASNNDPDTITNNSDAG